MLLNFCSDFLETQVQCDTPSTDGYEVNNLLAVSDKGFLAYSCIKPPINIDFSFTCDIKLSHIIIWPRVGAQKSTGFRLSTKYHEQYKILSTEFLNTCHTGCVFHNNNNQQQTVTLKLSNFSTKYINSCPEYINNLRLTILKTENSVPALSRIEIWGYICSRESVRKIQQLLDKHQTPHEDNVQTKNPKPEPDVSTSKHEVNDDTSWMEIPEEFLDPITCSIMVQPVVLPSGKIIDQSTLENFGNNEALWGRPLSDPFTGIVFTDNYRPIFSSTLKLKIDKFLSENAENPQLKNLPRTLGHDKRTNVTQNQSYDFRNTSQIPCTIKSVTNSSKKLDYSKVDTTKFKHRIPSVANYSPKICHSQRKNVQSSITNHHRDKTEEKTKLVNTSNTNDDLKTHLNNVLSNLKYFGEGNNETQSKKNICQCCSLPAYYQLPCNHIVCRKIIVSNGNSQCPQCNNQFETHDITRVHVL